MAFTMHVQASFPGWIFCQQNNAGQGKINPLVGDTPTSNITDIYYASGLVLLLFKSFVALGKGLFMTSVVHNNQIIILHSLILCSEYCTN